METLGTSKSFRRSAAVLLSGLLIAVVASAALAQPGAAPAPAALPDWLEPQGLSIIELVGQVPDSILHGTILSFDDGEGIVVYESGTRNGSTVVINTTIYPRFSDPGAWADHKLTAFGCLGQTPRYDHMGSVVPQSYLRIRDSGGQDRTSEIQFMYISNMDTRQPSADSSSYTRYPIVDYGPGRTYPLPSMQPDGLTIPTNSGCRLEIPYHDYYPLTGVFTVDIDPAVHATVIGSQEAGFQSYIGVGDVGIFQPLMDQLLSSCGERHGRIQLYLPPQANYFLVQYPPMPGDPYTDRNSSRPYPNQARLSSGTYRLGENFDLSTDFTFSAAFPLDAVWQDADQSPTQFLPLLSSATKLAPPEYVLPSTLPFNECYTYGNCSNSVLQQICDAWMSLKVTYLAIYRPAEGTEHTPIKMAGPTWSLLTEVAEQPAAAGLDSTLATTTVYLPLISKAERCAAYPCGWFTGTGRMLGYEP
jgi:hypothetical protein